MLNNVLLGLYSTENAKKGVAVALILSMAVVLIFLKY